MKKLSLHIGCNNLPWLGLIICLVLNFNLALGEVYSKREKALFREVRCTACISQSIYDSNSDNAQDLKKIIQKQIHAGKTDQEIKDYLVERFGGDVLFSPPIEIGTALLWMAPFLILLVGGASIYRFSKSGLET